MSLAICKAPSTSTRSPSISTMAPGGSGAASVARSSPSAAMRRLVEGEGGPRDDLAVAEVVPGGGGVADVAVEARLDGDGVRVDVCHPADDLAGGGADDQDRGAHGVSAPYLLKHWTMIWALSTRAVRLRVVEVQGTSMVW